MNLHLINWLVACLLSVALLAPIFFSATASLQAAFIASLFLLVFLLSIGTSSRQYSSFQFSSRLVFPAILLLCLAMIEAAHGRPSGVVYCVFSAVALMSGYLNAQFIARRLGVQIIAVFLVACLAIIYFNQFGNPGDISITSNFVGAVLFLFLAIWRSRYSFVLDSAKSFWLLAFIISAVTFTRSLMLGIVIGAFIGYYAFTSKLRFVMGIFVGAIFLIFIDQFADSFSYLYNDLNLLMLTGKNLDTGRGDIWLSILRSMSIREYLLGGADLSLISELKTDYGKQLSAHNGYISVLAHNGILGLLVVILLPLGLFWRMRSFQAPEAKFLVAFVTVFFVREFFEVTFHSNNFPIAGPFWFICGQLVYSSGNQFAQNSLRRSSL